VFRLFYVAATTTRCRRPNCPPSNPVRPRIRRTPTM
jgi:hypothetical protein